MQSLQRMHPLAGLSEMDRLQFLSTLDEEEQGRLELAVKFFEEHLGSL
jgi:hypothetical protein